MSVIIFDTSILGNLFGFSQNKYYFIIIISKSELLVLGEECNISELVVAESCTLLNSWMQKNRADYPTPECRRIVQTTQLLVAEESCRLPKIMTAGESCRLPNSWLQENRARLPDHLLAFFTSKRGNLCEPWVLSRETLNFCVRGAPRPDRESVKQTNRARDLYLVRITANKITTCQKQHAPGHYRFRHEKLHGGRHEKLRETTWRPPREITWRPPRETTWRLFATNSTVVNRVG